MLERFVILWLLCKPGGGGGGGVNADRIYYNNAPWKEKNVILRACSVYAFIANPPFLAQGAGSDLFKS